MIYFLVLSTLAAVVGLFAGAAATGFGLTFFGFALFLFGVLFGLATVKRHFDAADAARH